MGFVGALHQFHDPEFVREWAKRFKPNKQRSRLFELVFSLIESSGPPHKHVAEIGIGPGYLAQYILSRNPVITYEGVDFSEPMFEIAKTNIGHHMSRVQLTSANLFDNIWRTALSKQPNIIVSTWTLHDLGSKAAVHNVYKQCYKALPPGGMLINGDFIKPVGTSHDFEGGRFEVTEHLRLMKDSGFLSPKCLLHFEQNLITPTASENYACMMGVR
ncbi:MAG: class I SAM-dependent methyltransferase [Pseudomonadota bacterium]|nr:class I SAM-dependent methyltransferase [Pseudomonadota bacterium]